MYRAILLNLDEWLRWHRSSNTRNDDASALKLNLYFFFFFALSNSDPAIEYVDENILNFTYNDQQSIDFDDELNNIKNRQCCDGIYAGHNNNGDQIS